MDVTGRQPPDRHRLPVNKLRKVDAARVQARKQAIRSIAPRRRGRRGGSSWLLRMALRALKRMLLQKKAASVRNHGFKGVRKPNKTGLSGR